MSYQLCLPRLPNGIYFVVIPSGLNFSQKKSGADLTGELIFLWPLAFYLMTGLPSPYAIVKASLQQFTASNEVILYTPVSP